MPDPRLDEIIAERERAIAWREAAQAERAERDRRDLELNALWRDAYTDAPLFTEAVAAEITRRLLILAGFIRERFWDFHIVNLLSTPWGEQVCVRILAHACAGHKSELPDYIVRARNFFPSAYTAHSDLLDHLKVLSASSGLPHAPPMSQPEIAKAAGISPFKFRGQWRAGKWSTIDLEKYQRLKRWRSVDPAVQKALLASIREKWPEKMWSKLAR